jgi:uncharacterized protein (TIRG00374 family)
MRRLVGLCFSVTLLALLYVIVDIGALGAAIRSADMWWLIGGLALLVPLTLATAWRFSLLVRDARVSFGESNRLILASSTLNLFLPSKMGDLAKAFVLSERHGVKGSLALSIVVLEKALDMLSLLVWGVVAVFYVGFQDPTLLLLTIPVGGLLLLVGAMIVPLPIFVGAINGARRIVPDRLMGKLERFSDDLSEVVKWFWSRPRWAFGVIALSLILWLVHLWQFWFFTRSVGGSLPLIDNMAFATLSILIGLLPFTIAGIGSRDAAIVVFYSAYLSPAAAAFVGILATLRYLLPAIAGLPFVGDFMTSITHWRRARVIAGRRAGPIPLELRKEVAEGHQ